MLTENAQIVLKERYLWHTPQGRESFGDLCLRVARAIAAVEPENHQEEYTRRFWELLYHLRFLPNTPTLVNAGREQGQLAACFVLPVEDSIDSIFEAVKHAALIHKSGGGTGFSFSRLREHGALVRSTGKIASGPVSFMEAFDAATETIKQGGVRRGANMGILRVDHPDILAFIGAKREEGRFANFNLSVGITDAFMAAVSRRESFALVSPYTQEVKRLLPAREVLEAMVEGAWAIGEPGVIFLDTINRANPLPDLGEIEATNPCGEQPLLPYEACILGSVSLPTHLRWDGLEAELDEVRLEETVRLGVRFLDNAIEANCAPLPKIRQIMQANRKIGLGVMGFADLLLGLRLAYNSEAGVRYGEQLMARIQGWAADESRRLAEERGRFPNWELARPEFQDRRNATVTTIAPTGTIGIIAGVSSGIEPIFGYAQVSRRHSLNRNLFELNPIVARWLTHQGWDLERFRPDPHNLEKARSQVEEFNRRCREELPEWFVTFRDITPEWHLKMQAAFQRHVENAVSKTINLPHETTQQQVEQLILQAHQLGLKGLTIYRDGCRQEQVIYTERTATSVVRPRPEQLFGRVFKVKLENGHTAYLTVSLDEHNQPFEVFANSLETLERPWEAEAVCRLVSICLRSGVTVPEVCAQLEKANRRRGGNLFTTPALVKRVLLQAWQGGLEIGTCPECGGSIRREGGCLLCPCGSSSKCD